jgi:hypothetical protein
MKELLLNFGAQIALERPRRSLDQHALRLEQSGQTITTTLKAVPGNERNRRLLSHVIGIERWGQSRLRTALGEPLAMDEYNSYRPPRERTWAELQGDFIQVRLETLALVRQLEASPPVDEFKVPHNQYGPLSIGGWLRYIDMHANGEVQKMR